MWLITSQSKAAEKIESIAEVPLIWTVGFHCVKYLRAGKALRTLEIRTELYNEVLLLRKQKLSYNQIIEEIQRKHGVVLSKSHVSDWLSGKHSPTGSVRSFDSTPCPELTYVIGVYLGDASMSVYNYSYKIKLQVIDKDFAEEFARCISKILSRTPPRVKWRDKTHAWHTEVSRLLLRKFLLQPLHKLGRTINHCNDCSASFLRGFFDSEGSVSGKDVQITNTNKPLLLYVQTLLMRRFGIETNGPYLQSKGGRIVLIKGKFYHANKDCFELRVRTASVSGFQSHVGFTIARKKSALAAGLQY
jgi:intein-encoded DNA endonuclease-like protein